MRFALLLALLAGCAQARADPKPVEFGKDVRPLLEKKCQPCHFSGGVMYSRLPFDRSDTVITLGEKKMFTRIQDESERAVIRAFLAQPR